MAAQARPEQQLTVLGQRLSARIGADSVSLLEKRCGRVQARDLLRRSAEAADASPDETGLYELVGQIPKLVGTSTLIVSVPTKPAADPLQSNPTPAALVLGFKDDAAFLDGRGRSWRGLQVLGNLTHTLLESEHSTRLNTRLRQFHRRSVRPRRPADVAYLALHATRDVVGFDGHCALLLWESNEETLEVIAHLSGDRSAAKRVDGEHPTFLMPWSAKHASLVLAQASRRSGFLANREGERWGVAVRQAEDIELRSSPAVSAPPTEVKRAIGRLLQSLAEAELVRGRSALLFPLRQGGTPLGLLVVSAASEHAFTVGEVTDAWELALACIPPLGRASRLLGDFRLSESILERTSAMEPHLPLAENGPLTATLSFLCDRLASDIGADSVVLLPYDYKSGKLIAEGLASAGSLDLRLERCELRPDGVIDRVLSTEEPVEWYSGDPDGPAELDALSEEQGLERVYGSALRAPDGNPLGAVFIGWRGDVAIRIKDEEQRRKEISRPDRKRASDFRRVAEAYLARHSDWFLELRSQRLLSAVYTNLLQSLGSAGGDPVEVDFKQVRAAILRRLLDTAVELVGGTAGLFAEPSGEHAGLDVLASVGHDADFDGSRIPFGLGVTGHCAEVKELRIIPDSENRDTWPDDVEPHQTLDDVRCEVAFPVTDGSVHELLLGVFDLENQLVSHAYGPSDEKLTSRIAQAASIAIGLTRQFEQIQSIARLGRMIDRAIRDSEQAVFIVALEEAARVTGAFAASARISDRSGTRLLPVHHHGEPGAYADKAIIAGKGINGAAFRTEEVVCVGDTWDRQSYPQIPNLDYLRSREETRSECAIPIHWYGQRIGVCNFEHRQPHALTPYRLYLQTVGAQISQAVRQRREQNRVRVDQGTNFVEVMSAFYTTVNHSLTRNFTIIGEEIELLEGNGGLPLDPGTAERIERIKSTAEEGVDKAAALLRGATGELDKATVVTIRELLDGLRGAIERVHEKATQLEIVEGDDEARVVARRAMLGWILQEIVENSFTHGGEGTHVWVVAEASDANGTVSIVIDDDGSGLPPKQIEELYSVKAEERLDGHFGLGLIAAELYMRSMRGLIESAPSPKGGLRTTIVIPWHREQLDGSAAVIDDDGTAVDGTDNG